jgi:hypothetical protein
VRSTAGFLTSCLVASLAILATSVPAAAKPRPITGKLSEPGYSVIALAPAGDGRVTLVRASRNGSFRLRPPADSVTLQLRAPNGTYAGPIVFGRVRGYAIVGVRAAARLGRVRIDVRNGYARLARRLPRRWVDRSRLARTRRGVTIGNGRNYGFVRSRAIGAAAAAQRGPGSDRDSDGVPDAFDVAANGHLILTNLERSARARAAQTELPGAPIYLSSILNARLYETVNANAGALTVQDIDATLAGFGLLKLNILSRAAELDCGGQPDPNNPDGWIGGLSYCTKGGTGTWAFSPGTPRFPECCDPDNDGFGALGSSQGAFEQDFFLLHGATTSQIKTGDTLIERVTQAPPGADFPAGDYAGALQFAFATVPALVSYSDTAGNSATVSYPVTERAPGTPGSGFPVAPGPDGDIEVTLTFWRPQRTPIPPDATGAGGDACGRDNPPCQWVDIGGLNYAPGFGCFEELAGTEQCAEKLCPPSALSKPDSETNLTPTTLPLTSDRPGGFRDSAPDRGADPANTFTYHVNLSDCLRDPRGADVHSRPYRWDPGQERELFFKGTDLLDNAQQVVYFKRSQ